MNTIIQKIREDIFSAAGEITMGTWMNFLFFGIVSGAVFLSIFSAYFYLTFGITFNTLLAFANDPSLMMAYVEQAELTKASVSSGLYLTGLLFGVVSFAITAWGYNVQYSFVTDYLEEKDTPFGTSLTNALDNRLFQLMGFFLLMTLITIGMGFAFGIVGGILVAAGGPIFIIVIGFLFFVIMIRFALSIPAIVIDKADPIEAIKFSLKHISFKKGAKYVGMLILFVLAYVAITFVLSSTIGLVLKGVPMIALYTSMAFKIITGALLSAYVSGLVVSLYYREAGIGVEEGDEDIV